MAVGAALSSALALRYFRGIAWQTAFSAGAIPSAAFILVGNIGGFAQAAASGKEAFKSSFFTVGFLGGVYTGSAYLVGYLFPGELGLTNWMALLTYIGSHIAGGVAVSMMEPTAGIGLGGYTF